MNPTSSYRCPQCFALTPSSEKIGGRPYFEVALSLTKEDDMKLSTFMKQFDDGSQVSNGCERLGQLLVDVGQLDKVQELYNALLEQTSNTHDRGRYYHLLGSIRNDQGDYKEALSFYERALEISQNILSANHLDVAISYNHIGSVYTNMAAYSKALTFYQKDLEIRQIMLSVNHPDLATSNNNIGSVYADMGEYSTAMFFYEQALKICRKSLSANHLDLKGVLDNIELLKSKPNKK